jgi:hypothetical protein
LIFLSLDFVRLLFALLIGPPSQVIAWVFDPVIISACFTTFFLRIGQGPPCAGDPLILLDINAISCSWSFVYSFTNSMVLKIIIRFMINYY